MEKEKEDKIISIDVKDDGDNGDGNDDEEDDDGDEFDDDDENNVDDGNGDVDLSCSDNSNLQPGNSSGSTNTKKSKKKITRAVKEILTYSNTKFMSNFDPELSNREKRKLTRKLNSEGKKNGSAHDENGILSGIEKDVCDCLVEECPGCHFPCPKCRSCKCGVECRINRKWIYEAVENETQVALTINSDISAN